ncbi:hypothetical protein HDV04_005269 [Boothiomyces sp. JEL0838]|nr:hypothetical protein HDV04_005269 [Boothiomyces sp. JEL0838]
MFGSSFKPPQSLAGRIPAAPRPTTSLQKMSHSLPLVFHLLITGIYFTIALTVSILTHIIDGPLLSSWTMMTTIAHSFMKAVLSTHSPQGRHSFDIVRFATGFKLPKFLFGADIKETSITVENSDILSDAVKEALQVKGKLNFEPEMQSVRTIEGEWVRDKDSVNDNVILYLHGGAHIFMSPHTHRAITTRVSKHTKSAVFVPNYRLAPENPFPSAIEDALACYLALTQPEGVLLSKSRFNQETQVVSNTRVFLMGDSSGGCLCLQLLQVLRELNLPMPAGAILLSPFLDHKMESSSWHTNWNTDFLSLDMKGVKWAVEIYSNGIELGHSAISPIYANLQDFPPILIQSGDSEVVSDDALRFYQLATTAGSQVELQLYRHMFHVFHTFPFLKESEVAFMKISSFVESQKGELESDSGISIENYKDETPSVSNIYLIDGQGKTDIYTKI